MQQGPTEQTDTRGITYREFRQILSVTLRTTASPRTMTTTAAPWSTLSEGTNLEFRGEFFNIPNHPNLGTVSTSLFTTSGGRQTNAGKVNTDTATSSRQIQFALKLTF